MILFGIFPDNFPVTCQCLLLEPKLLASFGFCGRNMKLLAGAFEERFGGLIFFSNGLLPARAACKNERASQR